MGSRRPRPVTWTALGLALALLVLALGAAPETWRDLRRVLRDAELEQGVEYLRGFGGWTVLIIVGLFTLEALVAPVPAWFLMIANGMLFGPWLGALVSLLGVVTGALAAFALARWVARRAIRRLLPPAALRRVDEFSRRNGFALLLIARLIPFTSSDLWSYAAGLSRIPPLHFVAATALGDLPSIALFSFLGTAVLEDPRYRRWLALGGALLLAAYIAYLCWQRMRPKPTARGT
ncbi:MAG: TVP38/TMEM64 family protein [Limnochordales bacterium]|nr:TVP38/TMEM64 family protein [Limnochordales bacterium]